MNILQIVISKYEHVFKRQDLQGSVGGRNR